MSNQISNVLGVAIPYDLKRQMSVRSQKLAADTRSSNDLEYLANKSCWIRLVSSVRIKDIQYFKRYFPNLDVNDGDSLAKKFVLFAGTSEYKKSESADGGFQYNLRSGFAANGSYGMLGNVETQLYGYKPMPGITDARIETQGKLGSIRSATINFKAWDKAQLDIIDALYFKLGYTMFLEWGHTTYFDNGDGSALSTPILHRSDLKQIDPFPKDTTLKKEIILREISQRIDESNGNYDAMLGMCTNFNFSMNEDGGYDCTIKMIALGELASQVKINQASSLPGILSSEIKELVDIYNEILREKQRQAELAAAAANPPQTTTSTEPMGNYFPHDIDFWALGKLQKGQVGSFDFGGTDEKAIVTAIQQVSKPNQFRTLDRMCKLLTGLNIEGLINSEFGTADSSYTDQIVDHITKNIASSYGQGINAERVPGSSQIRITDTAPAQLPEQKTYTPPELVNYYKTKFNVATVNESTLTLTDQDYEIAIKIFKADLENSLPHIGGIIGADITSADQFYRVSHILYEMRWGFFGGNRPTYASGIIDVIKQYEQDSFTAFTRYVISKGALDLKSNLSDRLGAVNSIKTSLARIGITSIFTESTVIRPLGDIVNHLVVNTVKELLNLFGANLTEQDTFTFKGFNNYHQTVDPSKLGSNAPASTTSATPATGSAAPVSTDPPPITTETVQTQEQLQYQSGLEVFVRAIQLHSFNIAYKDLGVKDGKIAQINLYDKKQQFIKDLFLNGVLSQAAIDFANKEKIKNYKSLDKETNAVELMKKYASYGFNHNLMAQSKEKQKENTATEDEKTHAAITPKIPQVDFKELYKSYVVPYSVNQGIAKDIDINYPVYMKLGLLLLVINHMCTIYDSSEGSTVKTEAQTPLIYIDFNPETNFCLSEPLQMSTDPLKVLIPFRGTDIEYSKLFDPKLIKNGKIIPPSGSTESKELFKPQSEDFLSSQLPEFKSTKNPDGGDAYSGKIMNILVSCDYILSLCKNFANNDQNQSVKLRPFLQQIIDDINKYLGGINLLRLAYDDKSNCLYIVDDQVQPMKLDEPRVPVVKTDAEIPVFGKYSIARSLEIRTDISSKLSNMIAISANSDIKSDASKDGTPFGHFNDNYTDRYIPQVLAVNSSDTSVKNKQPTSANDAEIAAASAFNDFVKCALNTGQVSDGNISAATNYYIERMNKRKGENPGTESSAMIPISVNFSMDGISGLAMGHAFLLPKDVLPMSYEQRENSDSLIGFVVTGLNHSFANNTWITEVKANMMFLKNDGAFKAQEKSYNVAELSTGNFIITPINFGGAGGTGGVSAAAVGNYKDAKASALSAPNEDEAIFRWAVGTEGTILYVQWDIANWRTGHGSGTITLADSGKVINLDARKSQWPSGIDRVNGKLIYTDIGNDVETNGQGAPRFNNGKVWNPRLSSRSEAAIITQADADADLRRRIPTDFKAPTIATLKSNGIDWNTLPLAVKVAMVKACYGYGHVPSFMMQAYKSGGQSGLASVLLAKSQVPGNADYGAEAAAFLLS